MTHDRTRRPLAWTHVILLVAPATVLAVAGAGMAYHEYELCQVVGEHTYCLQLDPIDDGKIGDLRSPANNSEPLATVNVQRWTMALHASDWPGDPDARFPIVLAELNDGLIPKEYNLTVEAGDHSLTTTSEFHSKIADPYLVVVPSVEDGLKIGELWWSQVEITEDGTVIASTPALPVAHLNKGAVGSMEPVIGAPNPEFFAL